MNEQPELLVRLARSLARSTPEVPLPARLCAAYSELVGGEGGSISMDFASTERVILCATDDRSARIEDAQDVLREGPSLDAFRTGLAVTGLSPEEQHDRWPLLEALLEAEFPDTFLHAFPMTSEAHVIGVVLVSRTRVRELTIRTDQAQFLANAVGVALLGELGSHSVTDETWSSRDRVDQATGMVTAQLGVAPADARAVLRAHAYAHDTSLAQVSAWVLARRLSFADPDSPDGSDA
jgi:ANTAR domain